MLVEEYVSGREIECSVLGNEQPVASVPGEVVPLLADWYDFASKYEEGGMELVVPARIEEDVTSRVRELAVDAFLASDCEGMARVDFFVRDDGEVLVNELNTIPGFTDDVGVRRSSRPPASLPGAPRAGSSSSPSSVASGEVGSCSRGRAPTRPPERSSQTSRPRRAPASAT